jgi:hypothetical protein
MGGISLPDGRMHEDASENLVRGRWVQAEPRRGQTLRAMRPVRSHADVVGPMVALILLALSVAFSGGLVIGILVAEGSQRRRLRSLYRARFGEEAP